MFEIELVQDLPHSEIKDLTSAVLRQTQILANPDFELKAFVRALNLVSNNTVQIQLTSTKPLDKSEINTRLTSTDDCVTNI